MGWVNREWIQVQDGWVMGWQKREWAFDEMSVKDGVIVRIDQALYHPYLSH